MQDKQTASQTALITCSYRPDLARCERLCDSVDRYVSDSVPQIVIVPGRDTALFGHLNDRRRTVLAVEDIVPGRFRQLPGLRKWWLDDGGWPVRGWVMQQVTKLSANFATAANNLVFADSDLQFVRDLDLDRLLRANRLRLHRIPGAKSEGEHRRWHDRAAQLLGLPPRYFGADYVGQLISWRRRHLEGLQQHIEQVSGLPWQRAVARSLRVSEYILYGAYIEAVVGLKHSEHFGYPRDLCHCCWFDHQARDLASGRTPLRDDAVAVLIQSNLGLSEQAERRIMSRVNVRYAPGGLLHA